MCAQNTLFLSFLKTAKEAANLASEIHRHYRQNGFATSSKDESYNLITVVDVETEKAVVNHLRAVYPDHNIIAEEHIYEQTDSPYCWIIDPLDGTNNYVKGFPYYSVSIALKKDNEIIVGIVQNTSNDDVYHAVQGGGSFCNDQRLTVTATDKLQNALLITGFYYDRGEEMQKNLDVINNLFEQKVLGIRRCGSAAIDLCMVARGAVDGYWERFLNNWDYAAGLLILKEAGGHITDYQGNHVHNLTSSAICGSNGALHADLLSVINKLA